MLTRRQLATLRAALQFWREEICPHGEVAARPYLETGDIAPLTSDEVNELRVRFDPTNLRYAVIAADHSRLQSTTLFATAEKAESFANVRDHVALVLSQHHLATQDRQPLSEERHRYILGPIDGPTFREQRQLLLSLACLARKGQAYQVNDVDQELLDGLVNLTDVIADQAHDKHGVDCLLKPDTVG